MCIKSISTKEQCKGCFKLQKEQNGISIERSQYLADPRRLSSTNNSMALTKDETIERGGSSFWGS